MFDEFKVVESVAENELFEIKNKRTKLIKNFTDFIGFLFGFSFWY